MDQLLPLLRSFIQTQVEGYVMKNIVHRLRDAVEHHLPIGGASTMQLVLQMMNWKELIRLAQCNTATFTAVRAIIGSIKSPIECTGSQLLNVRQSTLCRFTRHLSVDFSQPFSRTEDAMDNIRDLPLLRGLTLKEFSIDDSELLVYLTRRPTPDLLQFLCIEHCFTLDEPSMECFKLFPSLHTLTFFECTLHGEKVLESLVACPQLTLFNLNFTPGERVVGEALLPIMHLPLLKRLHLNTLTAASPRFIQPIYVQLLSSPRFSQQLEYLSLCYMNLLPSMVRQTSRGSGDASTSTSLEDDLSVFSKLHALRCLELCWLVPLGSILTQVAKLPRLESLLIGDDNFQLIETALVRDLIHSTSLRLVGLFGLIGVPIESFNRLTDIALLNSSHPIRPLRISYLGERRETVMMKSSVFDWAR